MISLSKDYDFSINYFMNYLDVEEITHVTDDSQKNNNNFKHSNATKTIDISNSGISQLNHLRTSISYLIFWTYRFIEYILHKLFTFQINVI